MTFSYDADADVLYVLFEGSAKAKYYENAAGDVIRADSESGQVLSCTIVGFLERVKGGDDLIVPEVAAPTLKAEVAPI